MAKFTTILAALALAAGLSTHAQAETVMRCSHQLPPAHHIAQAIDHWAALVKEESGGELDVQIFGANSLVDAGQNIVSVAKGEIECAFSLNFQWGKTLPIMMVTMAPFAFQDIELWRQWPGSEAAQYLEEKLLTKGVRNVVWLFQTNTAVFTSNERFLVKPEDFQGVKIRGLIPAFNASLEALGAAPSSMSGSKVYEALATGVIDAGLTDVAAAYARKYYEVQDHFVVLPLLSASFHGYLNEDWYQGLSDEAKGALVRAGEQAAAFTVDLSEQAVNEAPEQLRAKGVEVHIATPEEIAALEAVMRPVFDERFVDSEEARELMELIGKL